MSRRIFRALGVVVTMMLKRSAVAIVGALVVLAALLASTSSPAMAATPIYVDASAVGADDGTSWANAFADLDDALAVASGTAQDVWVANGIYKPQGGAPTDTFVVPQNVRVFGGFASGETALSQRAPEVNVATLSGDVAAGTINDSIHVVTMEDDARLDGFQVFGGNADGTGNTGIGGGIYMNGVSDVVLANLDVFANDAFAGGGGIATIDAQVTIISTRVRSNEVGPGDGGGLFVTDGSQVTAINSLFDDNFADRGGAAAVQQSTLTMINATVDDNDAGASTTGLYIGTSGTLTVTNSILWDTISAGATVTYSNVQGGYPGIGNIDADPLLDANYAISPVSPAMGAANAAAMPADVHDINDNGNTTELTPDLRRFGRQQSLMDMGAIEIDACPGVGGTGDRIVYVDASNTGTQSGVSWSSAFADLQDGLTLASACDLGEPREVRVAQGTYTPDVSDRAASFVMNPDVFVTGSYPAGGGSTASLQSTPTILSGDLADNDNSNLASGEATRSDNSYHVVSATSLTETSLRPVIQTVRIEDGNANGGATNGFGGGLFSNASTFLVREVTIQHNTAGLGGPGITDDALAPGSSGLTVVSSRITDNATPGAGGGIYLQGADTTFVNATIDNNVASSPVGGGGVFAEAGANPTFINSLIILNSAQQVGGLQLADSGGGTGTGATISNTTIADNSANGLQEVGSWGSFPATGAVVVNNSILWTGTGGFAIFDATLNETVSHSTVQGYTGGTNNSAADPLFANQGLGIYTLAAASPGRNAGSNALISPDVADLDNDTNTAEPSPIDVTGNTRSQGLSVDMGAHESAAACPGGPTVFVDHTIIGGGGFTWATAFDDLQDALALAASCTNITNINMAQGTYTPAPPGGDTGISFELVDKVAITGGFQSGGTAGPDNKLYPVILSGDLNGNDNANIDHAEPTRQDNSDRIIDGGSNFSLIDLSHLRIEDGNTANTTTALYVQFADEISLRYIEVRNNASGQPAVLLHDATQMQDVLIANSSFSGNATWAVLEVRGANRVDVVNTTVAQNDSRSLITVASVINPVTLTNVRITQNTVIATAIIHGDGDDVTYVNTTIADNTASRIFRPNPTNVLFDLTLRNTIVQQNTVSTALIDPGITTIATNSNVQGGLGGSGNMDLDPLFINAAGGDFRLQPGSPSIDTGLNTWLPADTADLDGDNNTGEPIPFDLDLTPRTENFAVDMGAYENSVDHFSPLSDPCLAYDSTLASGGLAGPIDGNETRTVDLTGGLSGQGGESSCLPSTATAALVTIIADSPQRFGNLRLSEAGVSVTGGVVNFTTNTLDNLNTVTVDLSAAGDVDVFANAGGSVLPATDIRVYVTGFYDSNNVMQYTPITPCAAHDSRTTVAAAAGWVGPFPDNGGPNTIDVVGVFPAGQGGGNNNCNIPTTATSIVANLVAIGADGGSGHLSAYPTGSAHTSPNTTFADIGSNNSAQVVLPLNGGSTVEIDVHADPGVTVQTRLVILGYYEANTGDTYVSLAPCAAFDSRSGQGATGTNEGFRQGGETITYQISGSALPATQGGLNGGTCGVPSGATGVLMNVVAIQPQRAGNLQAFATGTSPTGGVVNFAPVSPAMNNSNAVPVPLSATGQVSIFTNAGPSGVLLDAAHVRGVILGYYI